MSKIEVLRLYGETGKEGRFYDRLKLKYLDESRLFYGVLDGKVVSLGKHETVDKVLPKKSLVDMIDIVEEEGKFYIVVGDEKAEMKIDDLRWLLRLKLYPNLITKIIRFVSRHFNYEIPENSIISHVRFEGGWFVAHIVSPDGSRFILTTEDLFITRKVNVNGIEYTVKYLPRNNYEEAIEFVKTDFTELIRDFNPISHRLNTIELPPVYLRPVASVVLDTTPKVMLTAKYCDTCDNKEIIIELKSLDRRRIYRIVESLVKNTPLTSINFYNRLYAGRAKNLEEAKNIIKHVLNLYQKTVPVKVWKLEPEEIVEEFNKAISQGKIPVIQLSYIRIKDPLKVFPQDEAENIVKAWLYIEKHQMEYGELYEFFKKYYEPLVKNTFFVVRYNREIMSRIKKYASSIGARYLLADYEYEYTF